jgi:hypothetical protein
MTWGKLERFALKLAKFNPMMEFNKFEKPATSWDLSTGTREKKGKKPHKTTGRRWR